MTCRVEVVQVRQASSAAAVSYSWIQRPPILIAEIPIRVADLLAIDSLFAVVFLLCWLYDLVVLALEQHAGLATLSRHSRDRCALVRLVLDAREGGRSHWDAAWKGGAVADGEQVPPLLRLVAGPVKRSSLQAGALELPRRRLLAALAFVE